MSKMRETYKLLDLSILDKRDCFEAGYQAAIAAMKEGGPVAWAHKEMIDGEIPLYKLPEDTP